MMVLVLLVIKGGGENGGGGDTVTHDRLHCRGHCMYRKGGMH